MTTTAAKLPRRLMAGGSSVAVVGLPLSAGSIAHKPQYMTRPVRRRRGLPNGQETVADCRLRRAGPGRRHRAPVLGRVGGPPRRRRVHRACVLPRRLSRWGATPLPRGRTPPTTNDLEHWCPTEKSAP